MNVLSLFDGISAGQLALQRAGINVKNYYASEIDKYAISITQKNFPDTIQLGDIESWKDWNLPKIDLIMGGSPCTNLSMAGDRTGLKGKESSLFFYFIDVLQHYNPKYFLLENVKMKKEWRDKITEAIGVNYILINSALVSAQNRQRYYWTNISNVSQPEDKNILLKDIILNDVEPVALHNLYGGFKEKAVRVFENKSPTIRTAKGGGHIPSFVYKMNRKQGLKEKIDKAIPLCASDWRGLNRNQNQNCVVNVKKLVHTEKALEYMDRKVADGRDHWDFAHHSDITDEKFATTVANFFKGVPYNVFKDWNCIRKFHPIECERLQTFPDNYTKLGVDIHGSTKTISNTQRYKALGNSWTVDVVAHIFGSLPDKWIGRSRENVTIER